jgi:hypothetical protein
MAILVLCILIVDVVEPFLNVRLEGYQAVCDAPGNQTVAVKRAGLI